LLSTFGRFAPFTGLKSTAFFRKVLEARALAAFSRF
jgi:hypothetical protein